jgi:hypothetical protein
MSYEIDDVDRELLANVAKALAYHSNGDPLKDFLEFDDITAALELLMRVIPAGDRAEAVQAFVTEYRTGYEAEPSAEMVRAAGGRYEDA